MDIFSKEKRSRVMSNIRSKDTRPELLVRSLLHRLGYRFTVNGPRNKELPGKPDIVLPKYQTIVFVHGCFWHGHGRRSGLQPLSSTRICPLFRLPKTRTEFWKQKIDKNMARDQRVAGELRKLGWNVVTLWECELSNQEKIHTLSQRLPYLIEQKPMEYQLTSNTCHMGMVAEQEGWFDSVDSGR